MIDALGDLNEESGEEFFVFFFIPSGVEGEKREVLENISLFEELGDYIDSVLPKLREELLSSITSGEKPTQKISQLLDDGGKVESFKNDFHSKEGESPPLCAYDLSYEEDDIIEALERNGLTNSPSDRVKVVFYPSYLSVGDKLLNLDYQDAVVASSAGIFPSYYEPWGYTPVETAANGALSITTDRAGFGQFLQEKTDSVEREGINILERKNRQYNEAKEDLAKMIDEIIGLSKSEITERKHNARKLAQLTSWQKLGENYMEAHQKAVKKQE
jgi:glycogen(starch) synthase